MRKILIILLLLCSVFQMEAQRVLSLGEFQNQLLAEHPNVRQSFLLDSSASAVSLNAQANLDPNLYLGAKRKSFGGSQYYNYQQIGVEVPTKIGLNVVAGYENNGGPRLANEISTGQSFYSGLSVDVQDLVFMNKTQFQLLQADLFSQSQVQSRLLQINGLLEAGQLSYYKWLKTYLIYKVYDELAQLNIKRLEMVRTSWSLGKVPAVDTIDVMAQLNRFRIEKNKALINWREEGIKLSDYIWDNPVLSEMRNTKLLPDTSLLSSNIELQIDTNQLLDMIENHPYLATLDIKEEELDFKGQQIRQRMMPDISFNALLLGKNSQEVFYRNPGGNFSYGLSLQMPLRLSTGRSMKMQNRFDKMDLGLSRDMVQRKMTNQVLYRWNELQIALQNIDLYEEFVQNSTALLNADELRYTLGSGTVFMINARENRLLDSRLKQIENFFSYQKNLVALFGELNLLEQMGSGQISIDKIQNLK